MQEGMVLKTDHGDHSPDKWAEATAKMLFVINDKTAPNRRVQANALQAKLMEVLLPHHDKNQSGEYAKLAANGDARLTAPFDPEQAAKDALADIKPLLTGSPWEHLTDDPEWERQALTVLATHFATAQHTARQWHAHKNPTPRGAVFLAECHPETVN